MAGFVPKMFQSEQNCSKAERLIACGLLAGWTLRSGRSDPWVAAFIFGREDRKKVERQFDSGARHGPNVCPSVSGGWPPSPEPWRHPKLRTRVSILIARSRTLLMQLALLASHPKNHP